MPTSPPWADASPTSFDSAPAGSSNRGHETSDLPEWIPSLDGLRAVSILLVIVSHLEGTPGSPIPLGFARRLDLGSLGVRVFFVISGFLITRILLRELERRRRIQLLRFYFRRLFRIGVPYLVFLACVVLLRTGSFVSPPTGDLIHALTYTSNYAFLSGRGSWLEAPLGHTWSLAVEEQFYLLWPLVLALAGTRRAFVAAAVFVLVAPVLRFFALFHPVWVTGHYTAFEQVGDAIAVGCLLAVGRDWLWSKRIYRVALGPAVVLLGSLALVAMLSENVRFRGYALFGVTTINVAIAMQIDYCVRFPRSAAGRLLNSRPAVAIGLMSYSLYLWQQLFLREGVLALARPFPLNLMLVSAAGYGSYKLVEKPALRLRQLIERSPRAARFLAGGRAAGPLGIP